MMKPLSISQVSPVDAAWLLMERPETPMHVGVLAIFSKPRAAPEDFLSQLAEELRGDGDVVPPWNCRLSGGGRVSLAMRWVPDENMDLDYHFRRSALPSPGGERELGVMVSRLHSNALDRKRPLWECHLIEGLERERFAIYLKIHQAVVNDVSAVPLFLSMLSNSASKRDMQPLWAAGGKAGGQGEGAGRISGEEFAESLREALPRALKSAGSVGRTAVGLLRHATTAGRSASRLLPSAAPRSTLNRGINTQRRFATQQLELARIEALAAATGSSVNVVLTYLGSTALRRFFKEYNALPNDSLVGLVPVSLRERDESIPGSAIAGIRVELGTHIGDSLERLRFINESVSRVREDRASLPEEAAAAYALMRSAPLIASQIPLLGRLVPPVFNLVTSAGIGAEESLYFNGAPLEEVYPMSHLLQYSALSIDGVTYADTINIGFTGARDTLPHLQRLAVYFGQAAGDLEELLKTEEGAP
jgi:diacylglycerol O-acyltransferase